MMPIFNYRHHSGNSGLVCDEERGSFSQLFLLFFEGGGDGGIDFLLFSSGNVDKLDLFFVLSLKGPMCHYTF